MLQQMILKSKAKVGGDLLEGDGSFSNERFKLLKASFEVTIAFPFILLNKTFVIGKEIFLGVLVREVPYPGALVIQYELGFLELQLDQNSLVVLAFGLVSGTDIRKNAC